MMEISVNFAVLTIHKKENTTSLVLIFTMGNVGLVVRDGIFDDSAIAFAEWKLWFVPICYNIANYINNDLL